MVNCDVSSNEGFLSRDAWGLTWIDRERDLANQRVVDPVSAQMLWPVMIDTKATPMFIRRPCRCSPERAEKASLRCRNCTKDTIDSGLLN